MFTKVSIFDRLYLHSSEVRKRLEREAKKIRGGILIDAGGGPCPYRKLFNVDKYVCLDIFWLGDKNTEADEIIFADATSKLPLKNGSIDNVLCTFLLEHLRNPSSLISEIHRILPAGGKCLLTTNMAWIYHPSPEDNYRFTKDSLSYLFKDFSSVKIEECGGYALTLFQFIALPLKPPIFMPLIFVINVLGKLADKLFFDKRLTPAFLVTAIK